MLQLPPLGGPENATAEDMYNLFKEAFDHLPQSEKDLFHPPPPTTSQIASKAAFYALSFIVAIIGNLLVVVTFVKSPELKTRFNVYMVNMAVCDLLVAVFCMWTHFVTSINSTWVLGTFMCRFYPFIQVTSVSCMILTLTATIVDRFAATIYRPLLVVTQRCQPVVISTIWICACLVSLPWPLYLKLIHMGLDGETHLMCRAIFPSMTSERAYITSFVTLVFLVPLFILLILLLVTVQRMWMTEGRERGHDVIVDVASSSAYDTRRQAVWMTGCVLLVMFLFWTPQMSLLLFETYSDRHIPKPRGWATFHYIALYLAYSSAAFHPMVFMGFNQHLRDAAWRCFTCKRRGRHSIIAVTPASGHSGESGTPQTATQRSSASNDTDGNGELVVLKSISWSIII